MQPSLSGTDFTNCALVPTGITWGEVIAAGCTDAVMQVLSSMDSQELISLLDKLGLYTAPGFPVETLSSSKPDVISDLLTYITGEQKDPGSDNLFLVSPLQMALAAATLSNQGTRPAPRLVMSVDTPQSGWVTLPLSSQPVQALPAPSANQAAGALKAIELPIWQVVASSNESTSAAAVTDQSVPGVLLVPGWHFTRLEGGTPGTGGSS